MPFKVTETKWLEVEASRVESVILMPKYSGRRWTDQSLKNELNGLGLSYTLPQIKLINDELHKRGIVEDV